MSVSLEINGLRKAYRDGARNVEVLRGLDLTVAPGELVAIVGPSGSGKSTLLHLIGGLDQPDDGDIRIADVSVSDLDATRLAAFRNKTIGFVFQFHELLPDFTALENVMLPGRIGEMGGAEAQERAAMLLAEVGLEPRSDHFPGQLSGGERQRVALCRALLLEPPLLLADEPTGTLDPGSGEETFQLLLDLHRRNQTTVILVTHNPLIAGRCGRLFNLEEGVLHSVGRE